MVAAHLEAVGAELGDQGRLPDDEHGRPRVEARECAIVGDRIETDIVMGKRLGLATVLVLTGITAAGDTRIADTAPDLVVPSIRDLVTS